MKMLSLASYFTQNKVSTRNPRHSLSTDIKFRRFKLFYVITILLNLGTFISVHNLHDFSTHDSLALYHFIIVTLFSLQIGFGDVPAHYQGCSCEQVLQKMNDLLYSIVLGYTSILAR